MNTSAVATQIANSSVIMMEVMIYCAASILLIAIFDTYASKRIGSKRLPAYRMLRPHRSIALLIVAIFTFVIGGLCLTKDLSVARTTLTYFGLPYFLAVLYFMIKTFRIVRSHQKWRGL